MTVDLNICKMGKKNGLRIISNEKQHSSEFYIQFKRTWPCLKGMDQVTVIAWGSY
jgi:hypothetical protein